MFEAIKQQSLICNQPHTMYSHLNAQQLDLPQICALSTLSTCVEKPD